MANTCRDRFVSVTDTERKGSVMSPSTIATMVEHVPNRSFRGHSGGMSDQDLENFLDVETVGVSGVRVDRTYSVHSGRDA